jgi:hypothetical protein
VRQLVLLCLAVPFLLLAACSIFNPPQPKVLSPPVPEVKYDQWGCKIPTNAVIATDKATLELASVNYRDISVKGVKVANDPSVLPLLSEAARDAESRDYLRCLAKKRDNFSDKEVIYLDSLNGFLATRPTAEKFIEWQKLNPTPSARKSAEEAAERKKGEDEAAAAAAAKKVCLAQALEECKKKKANVYGTYNQACDDPRTHYLVRRGKKEMTECYSVSNYDDCVGACFPFGEDVINDVCRKDAAGVCG